jgi:hypothetical protein
MQIIVKENKVLAIHTNSQDVIGKYPGCAVRIVPDSLRYDPPIVDVDINGISITRDQVGIDDPDPITNSVNIPDINLRKKYLAEQASKECQERIEYKDGETRYQTVKQNSFTDILIYCKDWLSENYGATAEEKDPYEERITKINSFRDWMRSVLNYYYDIQTQIITADEAGLAAITWDYSQFEATDPGITLEEVRI